MQTLNFALAERSYPIHIGQGLLARADLLLPHLGRAKAVVISNGTVAPLHLPRLAKTLRAAGVEVGEVVLPDGEQFKTWQTLNSIFDVLLERRCERSTTPRVISAVSPSSRYRRRCFHRSIRRSAARRRSIIRSART